MNLSFSVGSLVKARGREWVVLPDSKDDLLVLRPLGGTDEEVTGIYLPLESVESASFSLPNPSDLGDHRSCQLLRNAVILSLRNSAGPFRSFGRLSVEPRPYQLVPLLMALKLEPVRLLIADDVGVGKTIEACMIARELLDRGEIQRITVLCPPHLAQQWQSELNKKFLIEAETVLPDTAARLERKYRISLGQSLFEVCPFTVVSMDYIKSDKRREEFIRTCPELVIVDEAHTCTFGYEGRGGRQQRNELIRKIAEDKDRHLLLVTATPHSGKTEAFRSLLRLLHKDFTNIPEDLAGREHENLRRRLASYLVQRRRGDIRYYLQEDTPFPEREETEISYALSPEYSRFFNKVIDYTKEAVQDIEGGVLHQRVRWWSALALLRSVGSSPDAAAATLRNRASVCDAEEVEEADEIGRLTVMDVLTEENTEGVDIIPGADIGEEAESDKKNRRRLMDLAREAERLRGKQDHKLIQAIKIIQRFIEDGYHPIVFCRFIPTAEYLARELREQLPRDVEIACVTGMLPPAEREERVMELGEHHRRVLVCTECLSEGINLQDYFNSVLHYDLSWNPTRHEQRDGRVDRFGQRSDTVRIVHLYGEDNPIDGIVLEVLIRKHRRIRSSLGISVPVPVNSDAVLQAIFEGLLMRGRRGETAQALLPGFEEQLKPKKEDFFIEWDKAADREKRSRTIFAQESIKTDEVSRELSVAREAVGRVEDISQFVIDAVKAHGGIVSKNEDTYRFDLSEVPRGLRDFIGRDNAFVGSFEITKKEGVEHLTRNHPIVEGLASYVFDSSLDPHSDSIARRAGAVYTKAIDTRTTLLLVRLRYDIITTRPESEMSQLAEECRILGFLGSPQNPQWINDDKLIKALLNVNPDKNISPDVARGFVKRVVDEFDFLNPSIEQYVAKRARILEESHQRVRQEANIKNMKYQVNPKLPVDVIGIYVYLPVTE